jgi:hypothetical protein
MECQSKTRTLVAWEGTQHAAQDATSLRACECVGARVCVRSGGARVSVHVRGVSVRVCVRARAHACACMSGWVG